jgi:membrane protease subunit HflC
MRLLLVLIVGVALVGLIYTCTFVVDQTEYAIVKRFGDPVRTILDPGLRLKYPWPIDTVVRFDNRLMVLENPRPGEPDKEFITLDQESGIGKNVEVTTYTCWRIKPTPEAVHAFLVTVGDRSRAEERLGDVVAAAVGDALGQNDFSALVSVQPEHRRWSQILESIRDACRASMERTYGIEIVDIKIQRLNFPDQNRRNVFDRMRAERQRIAARYRSEGEEIATGIRAGANKQREQILAEAYMEAERVRGQGDAEAARIYAEAYGQEPKFYEFVRTLQSYKKTIDRDTTLILSSDSEFLHLLNELRESPPEGDRASVGGHSE